MTDQFDFSLGFNCAVDYDFYAGEQTVQSFQTAKNNGVNLAILRVGQGGVGIDNQLHNSQKNCKGILPRDYYFYLSIYKSANGQAQDCINYINGDYDNDTILWADFEEDNHGKKNIDASFLYGFMETIKALMPNLKLGVYSGYSFWGSWGSISGYWTQYPLWIAWPNKPYIVPKPLEPFDGWYYHQWSFAGDSKLYGAVDLNYMFNKIDPNPQPINQVTHSFDIYSDGNLKEIK